jgi:hypothetical protein
VSVGDGDDDVDRVDEAVVDAVLEEDCEDDLDSV